jgi:AraC-like DNA-binding protein
MGESMTNQTMRVSRARYATSGTAQAREFMGELYGAELKVAATNGKPWQVRFDQVQAGPVTVVDLDMQADLRFQLLGRDEFVITTMVGGTAEIERRSGRECFGPGETYLAVDPRADDPCRCDHAHTVNLPRSLVDEVVAGDPETPPRPWEFRSDRPITGAGRRWVLGVGLFKDVVDGAGPSSAPLVLGPATRMLAALALATFPNTVVADPPVGTVRDAHPDTLRRAIAFIEAYPDRDITVADIARAAFVTPRALQLAFRRHLDTTPTAYLRKVRLHHAHQDLLAAVPGDGATVAGIAGAWGFAKPSRFAEYYRAAYGRSPVESLRG